MKNLEQHETKKTSDILVQYLFNRKWFGRQEPRLELEGMTVSLDPRTLHSADCVVAHLPSLLCANEASSFFELKKTVPKHQVWIVTNQESAANYPPFGDPSFMALFDGEISFRQTADVWTPYIPPERLGDPIEQRASFWRGKCCSFQSSGHNLSGREEYTSKFMAHFPVASYGRFKRNRRIWFDRGPASKMEKLKQFDFNLAFENSVEHDYVTEKFFEPLLAGSIPVYLGAPNIDEFAPGDNCYINARDFPNPADLAKFMRSVNVSQYHEWRKQPLRKQFQEKIARLQLSSEKRIAMLIEKRVEERRTGKRKKL